MQVDGLPGDLSSRADSEGVRSILVRPEDGSLIVGENTREGKVLEIFEIILEDVQVTSVKRYPVGRVTAPFDDGGGVSLMNPLPDGRILFSAYGTHRPGALGILDPAMPPQDAVRLFAVSLPGAILFGSTTDSKNEFIYFTVNHSSRLSDVYRIPVEQLLATTQGTVLSIDSLDLEFVESLPGAITDLGPLSGQRIVASLWGTAGNLFVLDPDLALFERVCGNLTQIDGDINVLGVNTGTDDLLMFAGGPVNRPPFRGFVVASLGKIQCVIRESLAAADFPLLDIGIPTSIAVRQPLPVVAFLRGDSDSNGTIELTDGIRTLGFLFQGLEAPTCFDAADTDDSGTLDITDAVRIFGWLFLGQMPPEPPGPRPGVATYASQDCGEDPTAEGPDLGCETPAMTCP